MKIGIADPQGRVRFSLRVLLEQQPGWETAGEAGDGEELLLLLANHPMDLLLMEWQLLGPSPEAFFRRLRFQHPNLRVLILSGKEELRQTALRAGADAFSAKTDSPEKLLRIIHHLVDRMKDGPSPDKRKSS